MSKKTEITYRIGKQYVGNDCIQIMIPYINGLTILNEKEIIFHDEPDSSLYINKYLNDERRKQFPYSNIPNHYSKINSLKACYVNQIFEFEKPYIIIGNGCVREDYIIKNEDEVFGISSLITCDKITKHMSYKELNYLLFNDTLDKTQTYYIKLNGDILYDFSLMPEEELYEKIKEEVSEKMNVFYKWQKRQSEEFYGEPVGKFLNENPWFINYYKKLVSDVDLSLIDFNIKTKYDKLLMVRINGKDIHIKGIDITFVKQGDFKVDIYDMPINKYILEQIKYASNIIDTKDPKISLKLNPNITKEEILKAKQKVKELS